VESVEVPAAVTPEFVEEPAVTPARPLMNYAEGTMTPVRNNAEGTMTQAQVLFELCIVCVCVGACVWIRLCHLCVESVCIDVSDL
jgi:hypothetical protein